MDRLLRPIEDFLGRRSKPETLLIAVALAMGIAAVDYVSGADISLIMLFWIPVALVVWRVGTRAGLLLSLACVLSGTWSDMATGRSFHRPTVGFAAEFAGRALSFLVFCLVMGLLRERTRALKETAAQLRAFDYSVAHDLRSPVRVIASFAEIIPTRGSGLDDGSRSLLKRIVAASLRLSAMLEGLLLLSNLSQRMIARETVDLSELARQIASDLEVQVDGRDRELRLPRSLPVFADRQLVTVLMNNLLQNAWNFTSRKEKPVIELGADRQGGKTFFFVRDNGEGFDPAHAGELFQPFRRLPNAEGFPGQGIGLATAARVIQAHGGRIWATGTLGQGATFCFTLGTPS